MAHLSHVRSFLGLAALLLFAAGPVAAKDAPKTDPKTDPKADPKAKEAYNGPRLRWAHSYADAVAEAHDRGCVVFATFHEDGWHFCVEQHRSVFESAEFVTWANENVVMLVGHVKGSHKTIDVAKPQKGEAAKQCSLYPGLTCEEHERIFADVTGKGGDAKDEKSKPKPKPKKDDEAKPPLPKLEVKGFPTTYVIHPDGTSEKMGGDREPGSCRSGLEDTQKKLDEHPLPLSKWTSVKKDLDAGEKAFKASTWKAAYAAFQRIDAACAGTPPKGLAETLKARLDAIDARIATRAAEIDKGPGDAAAKAKLLKALRADYPAAFTTPLPSLAAIDAALDGGGAAPAAPKPADGASPDPAPAPAR